MPIGWCACFQHKMNKYPICLQTDSPFVIWYSTVYSSCKQTVVVFRLFMLLFLNAQSDLYEDEVPVSCASIIPVCHVYCSRNKSPPCFLSYDLWLPFYCRFFLYLGSCLKQQNLVVLIIDLSWYASLPQNVKLSLFYQNLIWYFTWCLPLLPTPSISQEFYISAFL